MSSLDKNFCCLACSNLKKNTVNELEKKLTLNFSDYGWAPWVNWESERTGYGKIIRKIAFYPSIFPLFISSDHYVDHLVEYRHNEYNFHGSAYFTWNKRKAEIMRRAGINSVHIRHPFVYWQTARKKKKYKKKGTLVFWPHSSQFVRVICNNLEEYYNLLRKLPTKYHPIKILVSSQDIFSTDLEVKNQITGIFDGPFQVDSVGNILDKKYSKYFYDQIMQTTLVTSAMGGSQAYYCLSEGIPYWLAGEEYFSMYHKIGNEFQPWDPRVDYPNKEDLEIYNWFKATLREFKDLPSEELIEFVNENLGLKSKTKRLFIVKAVWFSLFKNVGIIPKLYKEFIFNLLKGRFTKQ